MRPYVVLVTGSRLWKDWRFIADKLDEARSRVPGLTDAKAFCVLSGTWPASVRNTITGMQTCLPPVDQRGADSIAIAWAMMQGYDYRVIEPQYGKINPKTHKPLGRAAPLMRNSLLVQERPDLVLAFWDGESNGTADTIRKARAAGLNVVTYIARPEQLIGKRRTPKQPVLEGLLEGLSDAAH